MNCHWRFDHAFSHFFVLFKNFPFPLQVHLRHILQISSLDINILDEHEKRRDLVFVHLSEPDLLSIAEFLVELQGFHLIEQFCHLYLQ